MLRGQCRAMARAGFDVTVVSGPGPELRAFAESEGVDWACVSLVRQPSPKDDLRALLELWLLMRRRRPHVVEAGTPKAALLGALAARLACVPVVIHTLHGLRLETAGGLTRRLLTVTERLTSALADDTLCVSPSLAAKARAEGAISPRKGLTLASGSANGVNLVRFRPEERQPRPPTIGFVGRFTRDKGISDLLGAFRKLRGTIPDLRLLLVGDFEDGDPLNEVDRATVETDPAIERPGFVADAAPFYARMDVLALPSLREGLPQVVLEAAACGVPTVGVQATGTVDAVIDGETGMLIPPRDPQALAWALERLLTDASLHAKAGRAARAFVESRFQPERLWEAKSLFYRKRLVQARAGRVSRMLKRALDVAGAGLLLVFSAPLLAASAWAVRVSMGVPVLFRQTRPGLEERPFEVLKLRTMRDAYDSRGRSLPDDRRLTRLGAFLRRWSLDELPQLWNVLKGEMSLVGPRPLLSDYLPLYDERQRRRHWVRPGITGWAQIHGRNSIDWERRFELDVWYVENRSLALDLKILWTTAWRVLRGAGVQAATSVTPPPFRGSHDSAAA